METHPQSPFSVLPAAQRIPAILAALESIAETAWDAGDRDRASGAWSLHHDLVTAQMPSLPDNEERQGHAFLVTEGPFDAVIEWATSPRHAVDAILNAAQPGVLEEEETPERRSRRLADQEREAELGEFEFRASGDLPWESIVYRVKAVEEVDLDRLEFPSAGVWTAWFNNDID